VKKIFFLLFIFFAPTAISLANNASPCIEWTNQGMSSFHTQMKSLIDKDTQEASSNSINAAQQLRSFINLSYNIESVITQTTRFQKHNINLLMHLPVSKVGTKNFIQTPCEDIVNKYAKMSEWTPYIRYAALSAALSFVGYKMAQKFLYESASMGKQFAILGTLPGLVGIFRHYYDFNQCKSNLTYCFTSCFENEISTGCNVMLNPALNENQKNKIVHFLKEIGYENGKDFVPQEVIALNPTIHSKSYDMHTEKTLDSFIQETNWITPELQDPYEISPYGPWIRKNQIVMMNDFVNKPNTYVLLPKKNTRYLLIRKNYLKEEEKKNIIYTFFAKDSRSESIWYIIEKNIEDAPKT